MKASSHLAFAALFGLIAVQIPAQTPAPPAIPARPTTPPNIPRPVLPPGLQRPGITNPNAVPPAIPGAVNRPGLPAGVTGPKPALPPPLPTGAPSAAPAGTTPKPPPAVPTAKPGEKAPNFIAFDAETVDVVLEEYYRVTQRRVLKDRGLEATTVTIMVPGEFNDEEYQDIIEKGLLMHGLALVPSGSNLWKLVAAETGSSPGQQQLPMVLDADKLPETDQVVVHVATLNYLSAEEAATTLQSAIPPHPYGKIVAVPNARSLVITEASQTIRAYLDLIKQLDLPPSQTLQKTLKLVRTDPEEVAKQLESLLDLKNGGGSATGSASRPATPAATPVPPRAPAVPGIPQQAGQPAAAAAPVVSASGGGATAEGPKPVILPITRTSSLLVIARPHDIELIEKLIAEIDAEATASRFVSRRLNYIDLTTFLGLAEKALMRYDKSSTGSTNTTLGSNSSSNSTSNTNNNSFGNSGFGGGGFGGNSFGGGMGGGLGGGGFGGGGLGGGGGASPKLDVTTKANSVLIGRTLVIIDPGSSKFFASGPPEQLQTLEDLADELDIRPKQIFISAIIGEFNLSRDFSFGLDWINTLKKIGGGKQAGGILDAGGTAFDPANLSTIAGSTAAAALGGLTAYGQITKNLNVFMRTVETSGRFRVLQKPVVTTLNHQPASIYIGRQIAIAGQSFNSGVVGGGFSSTTQYIPVRLQLDITPHIYNDQEIMLEFKQQNNSTNGSTEINGNEVPNISEQGMSNSLIVPDRSVVMLGGLISERNDDSQSGLPFIVRLPLIKYLVGSTRKDKERSELMIFVQPMILPDGATHINEQTRFHNNSPNSNDVFEFAGYPEEPLPPTPNFYAKDKPRVQDDLNVTPPPPAEEKRGFLDKLKGLFKKQQ
jgi:type II secretion system protein D